MEGSCLWLYLTDESEGWGSHHLKKKKFLYS